MKMRNIPKSKNLTLSNVLQNLCQNKGQIKETTVTIQGCGHGPKWILGLLATEVKQQLLSAVELLCFFNFSLFVKRSLTLTRPCQLVQSCFISMMIPSTFSRLHDCKENVGTGYVGDQCFPWTHGSIKIWSLHGKAYFLLVFSGPKICATRIQIRSQTWNGAVIHLPDW